MLIFFIIKLDVHYIYIKKYVINLLILLNLCIMPTLKIFLKKINKKYILFNLILKKNIH
jgi:hypothetical protein